MLAKERLMYIVRRLENQPTVSVSELCKELNVSVATVRRDLKILEDEGRILRERGGAINKDYEQTMSNLTEGPTIDKLQINSQQKDIICQEAAKNIKDGELVFIDSGTTSIYLVPYIKDKDIKIVTNSSLLLSKLSDCRAEIHMLGGLYSKRNQLFYGINTMEQIKKFRFDHAFITANGIDLNNYEVYVTEFELGAIKQMAMERSKNSYLLIDSSKYSVTAICTFSKFEDFTKIYIDEYLYKSKKPKNMIVCKSR